MVQGKHGDKYDLAIYQQIRATSGYKGFRYEYPSIQKVAISQMTKVWDLKVCSWEVSWNKNQF